MSRRMAEEQYRAQQWERRFDANVEAVNLLCDELRQGSGERPVPYVDPMHDTDECRIVSLSSNPGPGTESGFISCENDDDSAARLAAVYEEVGLEPRFVMPWNVYPWYVFDKQDGKLTKAQITEGLQPFRRFLKTVERASAVVAHGVEAHKLAGMLDRTADRQLFARGFKVYRVRSTGGRAFIGSPEQQQAWLLEMRDAYWDAMGRAGIRPAR